MCGAKGSAPTPSGASTTTAGTSSGTSSSSFAQGPAPNTAARYEDFLNQAQALSGTPFNPAMLGQVAPLNDFQTQALQGMFTQGMDMGNFDPARVQAIESPYIQDVVGSTQNWFNNQNAIQGNDLLGQGIRSGNAFGGDRMGVAAAQMAGQQQLAQAPVIAGLYQSGYTQALNEYNQLKQYGLTGAEEAMKAGTVEQAQAQKELDVAQQNAMMQSSYPFQLANWYGSALGGIGPLTGTVGAAGTTTAANTTGISNPPTPNPLTSALGIGGALFGLGSAFFGKKGGRVPQKARGGPVDVSPGGDPLSFIQKPNQMQPPANIAGNLNVPNYRKYYLQMANLTKGNVGGGRPVGGSGIPLAARGGAVPHFQNGGPDESTDDGSSDEVNIFGVPPGGWGSGSRYAVLGSGSDASNMRTARGSVYGQAPEAGFRDYGDRPNSNALGVSEKEQGIALPSGRTLGEYYNAWLPGQNPERDMPELVRQTDVGPARWTGRGIDYSAAASLRAGIRPQNFPTDEAIAYAPVTSMSSPPGLPELQEALPGGVPGRRGIPDSDVMQARAEAGVGDEGPRQPQYSTSQIPGATRAPPGFAERLENNPAWRFAAGLNYRSPYLMEGIAGGMNALTSLGQEQGKQATLDATPKLDTSGPNLAYLFPWGRVDTDIPTNSGEANKIKREQLAQQKQKWKETDTEYEEPNGTRWQLLRNENTGDTRWQKIGAPPGVSTGSAAAPGGSSAVAPAVTPAVTPKRNEPDWMPPVVTQASPTDPNIPTRPGVPTRKVGAGVLTANVKNLQSVLKETRLSAEAAEGSEFRMSQIQAELSKLPQGQFLSPGPGYEQRLNTAKWVNWTMQLAGMEPMFDPTQVGALESTQKNTTIAGFLNSRLTGGGQHSAAPIVQAAIAATPGAAQTKEGAALIIAANQQVARRERDRYQYLNNLANQKLFNNNADAMNADFYRQNPTEKYAARARLSIMPKEAVDFIRANKNNPKSVARFEQRWGTGLVNWIQ